MLSIEALTTTTHNTQFFLNLISEYFLFSKILIWSWSVSLFARIRAEQSDTRLDTMWQGVKAVEFVSIHVKLEGWMITEMMRSNLSQPWYTQLTTHKNRDCVKTFFRSFPPIKVKLGSFLLKFAAVVVVVVEVEIVYHVGRLFFITTPVWSCSFSSVLLVEPSRALYLATTN